MITLCLLVCLGSILMDGGLVVGHVGKPECKGRNFPGGRECCESEDPDESKCTEGQGDCDSDVGCAGDLVCGRNNCRDVFGIRGASGSYDCCTKPNPAGKPKCKGRKFSGGRECCESEDPEESKCTEGQGDCDSDAGCKGDLVCGRNNCRDYISGASSSDDCCTTKRQPGCKQPWIQLDTGCYLFLGEEKSTWMEARDKCEQEGGYLVKVDSKEENDAIFGEIQSKFYSQNKKVEFWIGLFSDSFQYEWKWVSSGMPLGSYSNWAQGEPSPGEKCVLLGHGNNWTNRQCWTNNYTPFTYNALCEKEGRTTTTTTPPTECTQTNSCRAAGLPVGRCIGKSSNIPSGVKKTSYGRCNDGCQCVKFIKDCVQTDSCTANGGNCFPNIDLPFLPGLKVVDGDCEGGCICKKF